MTNGQGSFVQMTYFNTEKVGGMNVYFKSEYLGMLLVSTSRYDLLGYFDIKRVNGS
jgi:hypothetical protein